MKSLSIFLSSPSNCSTHSTHYHHHLPDSHHHLPTATAVVFLLFLFFSSSSYASVAEEGGKRRRKKKEEERGRRRGGSRWRRLSGAGDGGCLAVVVVVGANFCYDLLFGSVGGLHCTWLVPRTRASSDGVDVLDSGEWIHLKRGVDAEGVAQSIYVDTASCSAVGFGRLVESQEGLETEVGPTADLVGAPGVYSQF
ncbi:hypothetical protein M9H77_04127 [Catharanthus roseus]|uniref:Uncharacterized protein n=1 Tax=Catharanthus roseus TaxID=4058 RepID=A0ACC0CDC9_CATRO|nr:hypothetical protein M9H77_04127 [Catharanthus roseus]